MPDPAPVRPRAWYQPAPTPANDSAPPVFGRAEPAPRTARNALIAAALLLGVLVVGARIFAGGWTAPFEMAPYIKAGPRIGAQHLERDLLAAHGPGNSLGPLLAQMQRMGFACGGQPAPGAAETCRFRARRGDDQVLTATAELRHDGLVVQAITIRMNLSAN